MFIRLLIWGRRREAIDEARLIEQIVQGDHAKYREIIDAYSKHIFQVTYSVLHHVQDAEDAAQEAFVQIFKSLPQYRSEGFKTWITRIALHKAIDAKRKLNRRATTEAGHDDEVIHIPDRHADTVYQLIKKEKQYELLQKIRMLPPQHRDIIIHYYLKEKNYEQIAEECNIAIKTVESRLYRARLWIRKHWKEEEWRG
ncbi:RNA polymerase sigma factor [Paenibacillus sp. Marseille-Q4541]|uniref:RNA polymerase sigma factor n=1 Tax=Paenibacillus sp. Marseille-Q4541 TaxID=2831522 RepID=UPI0020166D7B|nr:RNA polymerase sigma factor [Paenibacillus sp. Marseille-Q4541]